RIVQLLSCRADSASWRLVAEATAVCDAWSCVGGHSPGRCTHESRSVAARKTSRIGREIRTALPGHRPRPGRPADGPEGPCGLRPPPAGVETVGPGRHSWE